MTSNDKDFRFMATNDLMTELQKDSIKLDDDSERKVRILMLFLHTYIHVKSPDFAPHLLDKLVSTGTPCGRQNLLIFNTSSKLMFYLDLHELRIIWFYSS